MREIKSFEELFEIQDEKASKSTSLDLLFCRYGFHIIDGYVVMIGADCKEELELFYISYKTYDTFTEGAKDYFKRWYIGE